MCHVWDCVAVSVAERAELGSYKSTARGFLDHLSHVRERVLPGRVCGLNGEELADRTYVTVQQGLSLEDAADLVD